jgi:uncharacterized protein YcfJ
VRIVTAENPLKLGEFLMRRIFLAAVALAVALPALGQSRYDDRRPTSDGVTYGYADVLRSDPIYDDVRGSAPREECYDEETVHRGHRDTTGGTVLGAIVGGALGNQVGKGDGRKAATIAGAVVGGAVGHDIAKRNSHDYVTSDRRCRIVDSGYDERRIVGYDVEYRFRGEVYQSRLNYDPGERLRVRVEVAPAE